MTHKKKGLKRNMDFSRKGDGPRARVVGIIVVMKPIFIFELKNSSWLPTQREPPLQHAAICQSVMFGNQESFGRLYGKERGPMPSLYESELRANGGAADVDASRMSALGTELVNRSGLSLHALWSKACGTETNVELARLPERLSAAGAGAIGPRELGQFQRFIPAANNGRIGWQEWSTAFGLGTFNPPPLGLPTAGLSSPERNRLKGLPSWMPEATSGGALIEQDASTPTAASEKWPGGFREVDVQADMQSRLAMSVAVNRPQTPGKPPYGTLEDIGFPPAAGRGTSGITNVQDNHGVSSVCRRSWGERTRAFSTAAACGPAKPFDPFSVRVGWLRQRTNNTKCEKAR